MFISFLSAHPSIPVPGHTPARRINAQLSCFLLLCAMFIASWSSCGLAGEQGRASWYGLAAHGKQTANGEIYNRNALTAAHKQLPFGSVVRVKNLKNGKHVLVRINDRGPFVKGRVVDLSRRAADILNMTESGVVPVSFEMVGNDKGEPLNSGHAFFVHISDYAGVMKTRKAVRDMSAQLELPLLSMPHIRNGKQQFAICSGPYATFQEAQRVFITLEATDVALKGIIERPLYDNVLTWMAEKTRNFVNGIQYLNSEVNVSYNNSHIMYFIKNSLWMHAAIYMRNDILVFALR